MTDTKQNLPVLLLLRDDIVKLCDAGPIYAYTSVYGMPTHGRGDSETHALYEPAAPRCRTCPRFSVLGQDARCQHEPSRHVPVNGSGYCHEHPEATRD